MNFSKLLSPLFVVSSLAAAAPTPFAWQIFQKQGGGNVVVSPFSIGVALKIAAEGARTDTRGEFDRVLGKDFDPSWYNGLAAAKGFELDVANRLWIQKEYPVRKEYVSAVDKIYKAGAESMDLLGDPDAAVKAINDWVSERTRKKIPKLLADELSLEEMIITNAIYLRGEWATAFDKKETKKGDFVAGGKKSAAQLMNRKGKFDSFENEKLQLLKLPYTNADFAMWIVLPKDAKGLGAIEKELSVEALAGWTQDAKNEDVTVTLPKFRVRYRNNEMAKQLQALGIKKAFAKGADFSGITGTKELFINNVIVEAILEIDEKGTEAAAATAVGMQVTAMPVDAPPPPKVFKADHPFIYVVRHEPSGEWIFVGRLAKP